MTTPIRLILFGLMLISLHNCANYRLNYVGEVEDWKQQMPPSEEELHYSVYLIGDAGNGSEDWTPPALRELGRALETASENTAVVFLGDNIYPNGMPPRASTYERSVDEGRLDVQMQAVENFPGRVFFIAGNHDWYAHGVAGVRRQARYLERSSEGRIEFYPRPGCGDPEEVELTEDLTLILLDTQWWLANWDNENEVNEGCEIKSRAEFDYFFREAMKSHRRKEVLVVLHHPMFSNGPHGGRYTFDRHIFPLRDLNKNYYIPLPVLGSFYNFLRGNIGSRQDISNARYRDLRNIILRHAQTTGEVTFASGHEHSMQFWEKDGHNFIVSGSGSKRSAAGTGRGALFAYGDYGYSRLDYYNNGEVWVNFYHAPETGDAELVFRHLIKEEAATEEEPEPIIEDQFSADREQTVQVSEVDFERSGLGKGFWGEHYRDAYASEVRVPELDLAAEGLVAIKRGGGFQTNSLRLEDADGRQYTLRSIDKDPSRTVAYPLNTDLVLKIVQDNFSASHPLAALAVVPLAEAVDVYHTNPSLVYLPQQQALGEYNEFYAGALYLFEERPDDDLWEDAEFFGEPEDIVSTYDMLEEVREEHDERIDQNWTIRSRLFDLVIGDWDRHDDQWRWARIDGKDGVDHFRPIPRDRDQAFANYDGFLFSVLRPLVVMAKQWRPYSVNVGKTHWATYNAYVFDQGFLTDLSWEEWQQEIEHIQTNLTDEVIEEAFRTTWPDPFLSRDAPDIIATVKGRRDELVNIARDYYEFLAQNVDVLGTDQRDLFLIERLNDEQTRIRVYDTNKDGEREDLLYDRTFLNTETKNVYCYSLDDDDIFEVRGEVNQGVKVYLIGGQGEDTFDDQSTTSQVGKRVIIQDFETEDNKLINLSDSRDKRSKHPIYNLYVRRSSTYEYDFNVMFPLIGFNPDDQIFLGINGIYTDYGFQKTPYKAKHFYGLQSSLTTGGVRAWYDGHFFDVFGLWDFKLAANLQTPLYARNFYGLGNETMNPEDELGDDYNRLRERIINIAPMLAWLPNDQFEFLIGPTYSSIRVERTPGRFIDDIGDNFPDITFDEGISIMSAESSLNYRSVDNEAFPTRGLEFLSNFGWAFQLSGERYDFPFLNASFAAYQHLDPGGRLVFASRLGLQHRFSDDFPFYLGAELSGQGPQSNIRGFRRDRFTGRTAVYHNNDLRWRIGFWYNKLIPMTIGLTASFDYGRVYLTGEDSDTWHYSYGGGLFLMPFDLVTFHIGGYLGDGGDPRMLAGGKFFF